MKKFCILMLSCAVAVLLLSVTAFAAQEQSAQEPVEAAVEAVDQAADAVDVAEAAADQAVEAADAPADQAAESSGDAAGESEGESAGEDAESAGDSAGDTQDAAASGPPDFNSPAFNPGLTEKLNVISSAIVLPLCFLSIILWFFRAFGMTFENKKNGWLKVYKVLRKIHIPVGAATIILGLYHTIVASINHGFSVNWGSAAMFFFLLGFVCWLLRKPLKRHWVVLHRFTTLIATICMMIHCAPYLKIVFTVVLPAILKKL
ncbi:MAG: hypothetical protein IJ106_07260 [Parasporobacterium sp.]|nr:hypothetical protein [Parasporobacterium sp.]